MREIPRGDIAARTLLTVAALLPYWPLLTFSVVFVTDDYFASDVFNGELPGASSGRTLASLRPAADLDQPVVLRVSRSPDRRPIRSGSRSLHCCPPPPALDALVIVLLLVAAHGTYALARRFGSDRIGAILAGTAFAGSGYIACQLKHLAIVSTVVWLPVGLLLIDRVLDSSSPREKRPLAMALFGLVFAEQVLCAFPQSAYICALVYGAFALFRAWSARRVSGAPRIAIGSLTGLAAAIGLGAAAGAIIMLPLSALGGISDRAEPLGYEWSTRLAYWPDNSAHLPRPLHPRRHLRQHLHRASVLLGRLWLRRRGHVPAGVLRSHPRAEAAGRRVRGRDDGRRLPVRPGAGDADLPRRLSADPRPEAVPVSDAVPDRGGAGSGAAGGDRPDSASLRSRGPLAAAIAPAGAGCGGDLRRDSDRSVHSSAAAESDGAGARVAGAARVRRDRPGRHATTAHVHAAPSRRAPPGVSAGARVGRYRAVLPASRRARAEPGRRLLGHAVSGLLRRRQSAMVRGRLGRSQPGGGAHGVSCRATTSRRARSKSARTSPPC